ETGYTAPADTAAAPAAVTDSLSVMARRFEEASVETDREALKEEVLELAEQSAAAPPPAEAKKEEE
ncbi:MAG: hypothetical protein IJ755_02765, partial [Bacteroidales bacterium]|nr:hypothetical protein [Bacteroidales bacterium]